MTGPIPNVHPVRVFRRMTPWIKLRNALLLGASALCGAIPGVTSAQELNLAPGIAIGEGEPLEAATEFRPERVRTLLKSIHGFTLPALVATSTGVTEILTGFIDDANEPMVVRRQAVKALKWFPTDAILTFIEERVYVAPAGLKHLYLQGLSGFAHLAPQRVEAVMAVAMEDADITVRYAALNLSRSLGPSTQAASVLRGRLDRELDSHLRKAIEERLEMR